MWTRAAAAESAAKGEVETAPQPSLLDAIELIGGALYPSSTWSCGTPTELFDGCHASFTMTCTNGTQSDYVQVTLDATGRSQGKDFYRVIVSAGGNVGGVPCTRNSKITVKVP